MTLTKVAATALVSFAIGASALVTAPSAQAVDLKGSLTVVPGHVYSDGSSDPAITTTTFHLRKKLLKGYHPLGWETMRRIKKKGRLKKLNFSYETGFAGQMPKGKYVSTIVLDSGTRLVKGKLVYCQKDAITIIKWNGKKVVGNNKTRMTKASCWETS